MFNSVFSDYFLMADLFDNGQTSLTLYLNLTLLHLAPKISSVRSASPELVRSQTAMHRA